MTRFIDPAPVRPALFSDSNPHPGFGVVQLRQHSSGKIFHEDVFGDFTCGMWTSLATNLGLALRIPSDDWRLQIKAPLSTDEYALNGDRWTYVRQVDRGFA